MDGDHKGTIHCKVIELHVVSSLLLHYMMIIIQGMVKSNGSTIRHKVANYKTNGYHPINDQEIVSKSQISIRCYEITFH